MLEQLLQAHADGGVLRHQQRGAGRRPAAHAGPARSCWRSMSTTASRWCAGAPSSAARKRQERMHLVEGLLIALLDIDAVIQVDPRRRRTPPTRAGPADGAVRAQSEVQADYILDTPLRRLTRFDRIELETEQDRLRAEIAELTAILESDTLLRKVVSDELASGRPRSSAAARRTVLLEAGGAGRPHRRRPAGGRGRPVPGAAVLDRPAGPHRGPPGGSAGRHPGGRRPVAPAGARRDRARCRPRPGAPSGSSPRAGG